MSKVYYKLVAGLLIIGIIAMSSSCSLTKNQDVFNKDNEKAYTSERLKQLDEYLKTHCSSMDPDKQDWVDGLKLLDGDLTNYDIFLTGEAHGVAETLELQLAFLKYFNQKAGVTYLLAEVGYGFSMRLNQYLESGDEEILKALYHELEGTAAWSKESYEFWVKLKAYNDSLPVGHKITVIGIDLEHQAKAAYEYIQSIIPKEEVPAEIASQIALLGQDVNNLERDAIQDILSVIKKDIYSKDSIYKGYLGSSMFQFKMVVDNLYSTIEIYADDKTFNKRREERIFKNFLAVYDYYPKAKYYGQWGLDHVFQKKCDTYMGDVDRFAMRANSAASPTKGKVLSIAYGFIDSEYMRSGEKYSVGKSNQNISDIKYINKYLKSKYTLFKLNDKESPLDQYPYFVFKSTGGATTEYYQYLLVIKKGRATQPFQQ